MNQISHSVLMTGPSIHQRSY